MQTENGLPASGVERLAPEAAAARERMEIALALARRAARPVALLAVAIEEGAPADVDDRVREAVRSLLRAAIGPDGPPLLAMRGLQYALLAGRGLDEARVQAERLIEEAKHLLLPGLDRERRVGLSIGLARDEREKDYWLEALLAVAAEGVEIVRSLGGEAVAHTELYALCQRKAERAGPRPKVVIPPELEARALAGTSAAPRSTGAPPRVVPQAKRPAPATAAPHSDGRLDAAPSAPPRLVPAGDGDGEADAAFATADAQHAIEAREREHREEVERLERRIAKLMETLDATERELRELARRQSEPLGVASFYRDVQGLSTEDSHYEVKAALMERILQANLELREILRGRSAERP